jgi:hypothetical protein
LFSAKIVTVLKWTFYIRRVGYPTNVYNLFERKSGLLFSVLMDFYERNEEAGKFIGVFEVCGEN